MKPFENKKKNKVYPFPHSMRQSEQSHDGTNFMESKGVQ